MIAKEIPKKARGQQASFKRLVDYITRAHLGEPLPATISNCSFDDVASVVKVVTATQEMARAGYDKTYHLVLSFHPEDDLSPARLARIEATCCEALGFAGHQRVSVLHTDTEHPHLHLAINRVHPVSLRQITPYYSHRRLARVCAALEQELGLVVDNHMDDPHSLSQAARDMEAYSGQVSLERYVIEDVRPAIALSSPASWDELHQALNRFGLTIQPVEQGMVLAARQEDGKAVFVRAALLGADFASSEALQERFGAWMPPASTSPLDVQSTYQPAAADALWTEYQRERHAAMAARRERRAEISTMREREVRGMRNQYAALREEIRRDALLNKRQKAALYQKLAKARASDRQKLQNRYRQERQLLTVQQPLPTWQAFLVAKAVAGDAGALAKLTRQGQRRGMAAVMARLGDDQQQALRQALAANSKPSPDARLAAWIASRNALVGKARDVIEHRALDGRQGEFIYRGHRRLDADLAVALLERDGVMWVMPVSAKQQALLAQQGKRGDSVQVRAHGYLQFPKKSRSRS
ncbi:MAG: TraI/MobA(P) family conjugative relaxase [Cardiobacteriaceae bacterium]|nr:TraI/MobA(P) family conjugative relaxase [Cardiobacteriaceae bacterium]